MPALTRASLSSPAVLTTLLNIFELPFHNKILIKGIEWILGHKNILKLISIMDRPHHVWCRYTMLIIVLVVITVIANAKTSIWSTWSFHQIISVVDLVIRNSCCAKKSKCQSGRRTALYNLAIQVIKCKVIFVAFEADNYCVNNEKIKCVLKRVYYLSRCIKTPFCISE